MIYHLINKAMSEPNIRIGYLCGKYYDCPNELKRKRDYDQYLKIFIAKIKVPENKFIKYNKDNLNTCIYTTKKVKLLEITVNGENVEKITPGFPEKHVSIFNMGWDPKGYIDYILKPDEEFKIGNYIKYKSSWNYINYYLNMDMINNYLNCRFKVSGEIKEYDQFGQLKKEYILQNEKRNGLYKGYHNNGKIREEVNYENDKRNGEYKRYSVKGQLMKILKYNMGNIVGEDSNTL